MIDNRKAFTLIELLAVILILGIIALIAVPSVNKVLEESRRGAFSSTVNNLTKKAEETCNLEVIKGNKITKIYTILDGDISTPLEIKGNIPDGEINLDNKCNVTYELTDNKYRAVKIDASDDMDITKCNNNCLSYSEPILNGAKPSLDSGMIPVTIENDGTVKKADIYSDWYNYENQKWANVVLVTDQSRENYRKIEAGSVITDTDILGYFVWIPRYKYRINTDDLTTPHEIDIVFENNTTTKSNGNATTEYLTHPGFTFGSDELNGIWVAKFETTGDADAPTVLPNVTALRNQTTSVQFATALKFNNYGSTKDAHMMKNTEWATATYLSHSDYGINNEVRINNNSSYKTGCGATSPDGTSTSSCQLEYGNNLSDLPQSTTGNITGVFDMSGGSWEKVMGSLNNTLASSGFDEIPDLKYYNLYENSSYLTACNSGNCLGHATTETKNWYSDYYAETSSSYSWVSRGGNCISASNAGIYNVRSSNGGAYSDSSFRVVLG